MRRIYIHLIAIVIASVAAWLTWELVLKDQVAEKPAPALTPTGSGSGSSGSGSGSSN